MLKAKIINVAPSSFGVNHNANSGTIIFSNSASVSIVAGGNLSINNVSIGHDSGGFALTGVYAFSFVKDSKKNYLDVNSIGPKESFASINSSVIVNYGGKIILEKENLKIIKGSKLKIIDDNSIEFNNNSLLIFDVGSFIEISTTGFQKEVDQVMKIGSVEELFDFITE
jgi:hypothetical protein